MDEVQAQEAIRRALAAVVPGEVLEDVLPDEPLRTALDLDSLDFLNLVEKIADLTGVEVPEADYGRVNSFADLTSYLVARSAPAQAG